MHFLCLRNYEISIQSFWRMPMQIIHFVYLFRTCCNRRVHTTKQLTKQFKNESVCINLFFLSFLLLLLFLLLSLLLFWFFFVTYIYYIRCKIKLRRNQNIVDISCFQLFYCCLWNRKVTKNKLQHSRFYRICENILIVPNQLIYLVFNMRRNNLK